MVEEDCSNLLLSDPYWLPHGLQGEGRRIQPYSCSTVIIPCDFRPFLHFSPNGRRSVAGGCSSSVWNVTCCSCTAVLTHDPFEICSDVLLNHTAVLTHDPFEIRFGQFFLTIHTKRLVYHRPKSYYLPEVLTFSATKAYRRLHRKT